MQENVVILFGGKSVESDISVITALQAMRNLPKQYKFVPVYIDKSGKWWIADNICVAKTFENFEKNAKNKKQVSFAVGENVLYIKKNGKFKPHEKISCVLNCCHGGAGEDGSIQGFLQTCEIAQTCSLNTSSALCMDKAFMKDIFKANEIASPQYCIVKRSQSLDEDLIKKVGFPLIVKPANLGSSIGISVCHNQEEFRFALEHAFLFDEKVVVEALVQNLREFNCACFEYKNKHFMSKVCEVKNKSEIYTFEDKYISKDTKNKEVDKKLTKQIQELTRKIYKLFDCQGVVRIDFLYDDKTKILYANEINTIPGSLAFYLFNDVTFADLIASLIEQAKQKFKQAEKLIKSYESDAVKIFESVEQMATKK